MKIIYVNCGVQELFEGRSSQLYTKLMQLRKESLKKNISGLSGLYGIQTLDSCETGAALYQLSHRGDSPRSYL